MQSWKIKDNFFVILLHIKVYQKHGFWCIRIMFTHSWYSYINLLGGTYIEKSINFYFSNVSTRFKHIIWVLYIKSVKKSMFIKFMHVFLNFQRIRKIAKFDDFNVKSTWEILLYIITKILQTNCLFFNKINWKDPDIFKTFMISRLITI